MASARPELVESQPIASIRGRRFLGLSALDRLTMLYVTAASILLIAHVANWRDARPSRWETECLIALHAIALAFALFAPRVRMRYRGEDSFVAEWYPVIVMMGLYAGVGLLNTGAGGGATIVFDSVVQRWELAIFGRQISYDWIRAMPSPALSWALNLSYLSYYVLVIAAPAALWLLGRRRDARQAIFAISLTFFACYLAFLLFPVAGPLYAWPFPTNAATTVWPARVVRMLLERGDAWGSAFPSSHVAASVVATIFAWRGSRQLGAVLLVPTVGIFFAVVFGQIHYGVDAVGGLAVAAVVWAATPRLCRGRCPHAEATTALPGIRSAA
ncbi:MAG: phosphatase PAP2 family protein [Gemmatimonadales bacterium]|nr:phosphatase PAP2 family protein [Gemmatimonadales bacterium]